MSAHNRLPHGKLFLIFLSLSVILISCSFGETDRIQFENCILNEIRYDQFNSLKFQTISGGRIYRATQEFLIDDEVDIVGAYQFQYAPGLITIINEDQPFSLKPFMTVVHDDFKPTQIQRYFYISGVTLYHDITYPQENIIRIELTRETSAGDLFTFGYSIYELNSDGNIIRNERFFADIDNPTEFEKVQDRFYSYDDFPSPQVDLYLPFFADINFPDVKFFSTNNILSFTENNQVFQFQYEYGENNNTLSQTLPVGQSIEFKYANCDS